MADSLSSHSKNTYVDSPLAWIDQITSFHQAPKHGGFRATMRSILGIPNDATAIILGENSRIKRATQ